MSSKQEFYQVSLKLLLKNSQGEVLALKAVDNGTFAGFYDFPGGRIEKTEFETPLIDILRREAEEEIGQVKIEIKNHPVAVGRHLIPAKFTADKLNDVPVLYVFFEGVYFEGDLKISDEHLEYQWLNLDEINIEEYFTSGILQGVQMYLNR